MDRAAAALERARARGGGAAAPAAALAGPAAFGEVAGGGRAGGGGGSGGSSESATLEAFMFPPPVDAGPPSGGSGGGHAGGAASSPQQGMGRSFEAPSFPFEHHPARARPRRASRGVAVLEREAWEQLDLPVELPPAAPSEAALPPLQSVVELTTAFQPPVPTAAIEPEGKESASGEEARAATRAATAPEVFAVDALEEDGEGVLPDGTEYRRTSGEERGPEGFWKRWTKVEGSCDAGSVQWTEIWWESSDWNGLKELGAEKTGCDANGGAWREAWCEKLYVEASNSQPTVSRTAHKWAQSCGGKGEPGGEEWEEQWTELYHKSGLTEKSAAKWATKGDDEWHEAWGEKYDGGGGCKKWTDRWAEAAGGQNRWGEKWEEDFKGGVGSKHGEAWSQPGGGDSYSRKWGEEHEGQGWVHKWGSSTSGEHWDTREQSGTYYNPVPHFGWDLAVAHSKQLLSVEQLPKDEEPEELGLGFSGL